MIISQSGETSDLNNCIQICREFSSNRKNMLKYNLDNTVTMESIENLSVDEFQSVLLSLNTDA